LRKGRKISYIYLCAQFHAFSVVRTVIKDSFISSMKTTPAYTGLTTQNVTN
jgi:hypothetical protein